MRVLITHAGLTDELQQRLKLAAQLLASHHIKARVSDWDGTRCDILATSEGDAYGQRAQDVARRYDAKNLVFASAASVQSPDRWSISPSRPARELADLLLEIIRSEADGATGAEGVAEQKQTRPTTPGRARDEAKRSAGTDSGLVRLATDQTLKVPAVRAYASTYKVTIMLSDSRVYASSMSDIHASAFRLCEPGWQFKVIPAAPSDVRRDEVSLSLDGYLLYGALRAPEKLPTFPEGSYSLDTWPDLGSVPELLGAMRVTQELLKQPMSTKQLAQTCQMDIAEVSACLSAFKAAQLLITDDAPPAPLHETTQREQQFSGVLGKIAAKFGLSKWLERGH